jgi:hypothetical protein
LQQFPFGTIKIDGCFAQRVASNRNDAVLSDSIIEMISMLEPRSMQRSSTRFRLDFRASHRRDCAPALRDAS